MHRAKAALEVLGAGRGVGGLAGRGCDRVWLWNPLRQHVRPSRPDPFAVVRARLGFPGCFDRVQECGTLLTPMVGVVSFFLCGHGIARRAGRVYKWRPGRRILCAVQFDSLFLSVAWNQGFTTDNSSVLQRMGRSRRRERVEVHLAALRGGLVGGVGGEEDSDT